MLIDGRIFIPDFELEWQFVQSPGPGGQNVNKVATSARLTFRLADSVSLPPEIKARLLERLGSRLNAAGELVYQSPVPERWAEDFGITDPDSSSTRYTPT